MPQHAWALTGAERGVLCLLERPAVPSPYLFAEQSPACLSAFLHLLQKGLGVLHGGSATYLSECPSLPPPSKKPVRAAAAIEISAWGSLPCPAVP